MTNAFADDACVLQAMNHPNVSVLDGGLPRYKAEGFALDTDVLSSEEEGVKRAHVDQEVGPSDITDETIHATANDSHKFLLNRSIVAISCTIIQ